MSKFRCRKQRLYNGFTIIELLIVIVVIGILAAIVIIAFNGVNVRSKDATLISDLNGAASQLSMYKVDNDSYPTSNDCTTSQNPTPPKICLKSSGTNFYSLYSVDTSIPGAPHYKLIASNGTSNFYVSDTQIPTRSPASVASGGTITTSGSYTLHTFLIGGTFTVTSGTISNVSILIIGGGGGGGAIVAGGSNESGGGGGGQFIELSNQNVTGAITVTVGSGGVTGMNGTITSFGTTNAIGGGGGGPTNGAGKNGANGGGGGDMGQLAGTGTAGFSGGPGGTGGTCGGVPGGGGGAGAVGQTGSSCIGAQGGTGKISTITGSSVYYAGGGSAEGSAAMGGGGNGPYGSSPNSGGTANTGGGGGSSFAGGSGLVVVRYTTP